MLNCLFGGENVELCFWRENVKSLLALNVDG